MSVLFFILACHVRLGRVASWAASYEDALGAEWGASTDDTCKEEDGGLCAYVPIYDSYTCCKDVAELEGITAAIDGTCPLGGVSTLNDPSMPSGCLYKSANGPELIVFNEHPNGAGNSEYEPLCQQFESGDCCAATDPAVAANGVAAQKWCLAPTPTPTLSSVSGDPIVNVRGYLVKFDLPLHVDSLLLSYADVRILGRADVVTPDGRSQWFSRVGVVRHGQEVARIQSKQLGSSLAADDAGINSVSLAVDNHTIQALGSYRDGEIRVRRDGTLVGHVPKEIVACSFGKLRFSIAPQIAKKFADLHKARKYVHLDFDLHDIAASNGGIFAELFGVVPMSRQTATLIRSLKLNNMQDGEHNM